MPTGINICIKWSMLELKGLLEDEDARVYFQRTKRHLGLHPYQLNDLNTALREILSAKVNFYDSDLHGLVLAYKNPKLLDSLGGILHDSYFIHVDIEADFYIFKPEIGCTLKGIANKKAGNHLGVLVHKAFNVSILKSDECQEWLGDYVFVGQEVKFTVTHLDFKGKLPFIRGKLIPDATMGQIFYDSMNNEESEEKPTQLSLAEENSKTSEKRKKKSKKIHTTLNGEEDNEINVNEAKNGTGAFADTDESSDYRDKTKKHHSARKKSKDKKNNSKNDTSDSGNSSDDGVQVKKHHKSAKKTSNEMARDRNSQLEDSGDHRDEMNESSLSVKKRIQKRIRAKNVIIDSESSSDDSYNLVAKISRRKRRSTDSETSVNVKPQKRISRDEEANTSVEEKPRFVESEKSSKSKTKTIEGTAKSRELEDPENARNRGVDHEDPNDVLSSPMKRSKKKRIVYSEDEDETDVKPEIKTKKKKTKKDEEKQQDAAETEESESTSKSFVEEQNNIKIEHKEEKKKKNRSNASEDNSDEKIEKRERESSTDEEKSKRKKKKPKVEEDAQNAPDANEFEFIKPDVDAFQTPSVKCKRKRRRTVTDDNDEAPVSTAENTPDGNDFFRDVRIKVEPESSDVEDVKPSRKRKKSSSTDENFKIKQERNTSDAEDSKSDRKKSKRKSYEENSYRNVKVKTEPDASDIEESRTFKSEPEESLKFHKSTIIKSVTEVS